MSPRHSNICKQESNVAAERSLRQVWAVKSEDFASATVAFWVHDVELPQGKPTVEANSVYSVIFLLFYKCAYV